MTDASPLVASTTETAKPSNQALYDAQEYLVAGSANHAEWWAHLGDAHRDYAALAQAATDLVARVEALLAERDAHDTKIESLNHRVGVLVAERDALQDLLRLRRTRPNCCGCTDDICTLDHGRAELAEGRVAVLEAALRQIAACETDPVLHKHPWRIAQEALGAVLAGGDAACGALMDSNIRCVLLKGHDGGHAGGPVGDAAAEEKP